MPAYERAELTAELRIAPSPHAARPPREQIEAARRTASETGLAHEAGPESTLLAGERRQVLRAALAVIEASLDAGARTVELKVVAQGDAPRFDEG